MRRKVQSKISQSYGHFFDLYRNQHFHIVSENAIVHEYWNNYASYISCLRSQSGRFILQSLTSVWRSKKWPFFCVSDCLQGLDGFARSLDEAIRVNNLILCWWVGLFSFSVYLIYLLEYRDKLRTFNDDRSRTPREKALSDSSPFLPPGIYISISASQ